MPDDSDKTKRVSNRAAWSRRRFMQTAAGFAATAGALRMDTAAFAMATDAVGPGTGTASFRKKKIALLATEVRKYSHAQHFIDRCLEGYGWHGLHHRPDFELAGLYVDQFPSGDLSRERARRHGVTLYPTIAEALTLGGEKLAVDGVLIIAEHGDYPRNAKGQKLYPRYKFFKQVVDVFENSGRSAPVFNDKHLSTRWSEAAEMVEDSHRLGFAFMAGSSLPVTWRIPSIEIPWDSALSESVCVCYGGVDSYDIHGLETAQCMSERRAGGEVGVRSVHAARGAKVWELLAGRPRTERLILAALARSHQIKPPPGYTSWIPSLEWVQSACPDAVAYFIEHLDGFQTTLLMLNGLVLDFTYAGIAETTGQIFSCQMHLPMPPRQTTLADFFNPLMNNIERMIRDGKPSYPVERTLLATGMTMFGVESLYRGQVRLLTPELNVAYESTRESTYWRA